MTNRFRNQHTARSPQRGFLLNPFRFGVPGSDPYFASVVSLLHFDGSNGSTTFTDQKGRTWTGVGNAQISTADSEFGGASLALDGSGDWIQTPTSADFVFSGDFTIEGWLKLTAQTTDYMTILGGGDAGFSGNSSFLMCYGNAAPSVGNRRKLAFGNGSFNPLVSTTTLLNISTWYYFAVSRSGSTARLFLDGVQEASVTNTSTFDFSTLNTRIGSNGWDGASSHFPGFIDEIRITKGVGRYSANFTPPTAAFPNF